MQKASRNRGFFMIRLFHLFLAIVLLGDSAIGFANEGCSARSSDSGIDSLLILFGMKDEQSDLRCVKEKLKYVQYQSADDNYFRVLDKYVSDLDYRSSLPTTDRTNSPIQLRELNTVESAGIISPASTSTSDRLGYITLGPDAN